MKFGPIVCFEPRRLPTEPGSGNMALCPTFGLPRQSFGGAGREYGVGNTVSAFPAYGEAPLWYAHDEILIGLEGVPYWGINPTAPSDFEGM